MGSGRGDAASDKDDFQARSVAEGQQARKIARQVLEGVGFEITATNYVHPVSGATINIMANDKLGREWCFDVMGAFTSDRAGMKRTDSTWKALGRASTLSAVGIERLVLVTTNLPLPQSVGGKALHAARGTFFDAVEMVTDRGRERLRAYATGEHDRPLPGFLTPSDVYGDELHEGGEAGATYEVSVAAAGDPLSQLFDDYSVTGLEHRLKVVIPSTDRHGAPLASSDRTLAIEKVETMVNEFGGGCTTHKGEGSWTDPLGGTVHEDVLVLETYAEKQFDESIIRPIVETVLGDLNQDAASVVVDEKMMYFERP